MDTLRRRFGVFRKSNSHPIRRRLNRATRTRLYVPDKSMRFNLRRSSQEDGNYIYQGAVPASESGTYGFSTRVVSTHPCLMQMHELRLITWS